MRNTHQSSNPSSLSASCGSSAWRVQREQLLKVVRKLDLVTNYTCSQGLLFWKFWSSTPVHLRFHDYVGLYSLHKAIVIKIVDGTQNHLACCFFPAALQCAFSMAKAHYIRVAGKFPALRMHWQHLATDPCLWSLPALRKLWSDSLATRSGSMKGVLNWTSSFPS
jgi:hypothetical protein